MCPACASVGAIAIAGVVSAAGLTSLLVNLRVYSRGDRKVNR